MEGYFRNPTRLEGFAAEMYGFQTTNHLSRFIIVVRFERDTKALVAQWIERLVAVQKVAGPIPAKRTRKTPRTGSFLVHEEQTNDFVCVRNRTPEGLFSVGKSARRCLARVVRRDDEKRRRFLPRKILRQQTDHHVARQAHKENSPQGEFFGARGANVWFHHQNLCHQK